MAFSGKFVNAYIGLYTHVPTVFMLIERMIQLLQENSIPGIVCTLLERKLLPAIIFYESN